MTLLPLCNRPTLARLRVTDHKHICQWDIDLSLRQFGITLSANTGFANPPAKRFDNDQ
jgi:hypothetical protein